MEIRRHPWNTGFAWEDHPGPFRTVTADQARAFDEDGFFVLDGVLTPDELARTVAEIDTFEAKTERFLEGRENGRFGIAEAGAITFSTHLVTRSEWLRDLVRKPVLTGLVGDLVGPDVRLYWDQAVYKKPEKPRPFPWHQDNGYAYVEPQQYVTVWLALIDAFEENGSPQVATGLHREGTLRHYYVDPLGFECFPEPERKAVAAVAAGSAVVFSSLTPHLTGPNLTAAVRKAYIIQYCPDGAAVLKGDPAKGPPTERQPCVAADRQFLVVRRGEPVP